MGLDSSVGLIVATLDLQLVRTLRAAMAGGAGAGSGPVHPLGPRPSAAPSGATPRGRADANPVVEPRPRVRPEPAFEPRMKLRAAALPAACGCAAGAQLAPTVPAETGARPSSPVEPPWKVLPWERRLPEPAPRVVRKIKVVVARPDSYCKGSVLDLFI